MKLKVHQKFLFVVSALLITTMYQNCGPAFNLSLESSYSSNDNLNQQLDPDLYLLANKFFPGTEVKASSARIWRLTPQQIQNNISAALPGNHQKLVDRLSNGTEKYGFTNLASELNFIKADFDEMYPAFEDVASEATNDMSKLFPDCGNANSPSSDCVKAFLKDSLPKLFRRKVSVAETERYVSQYAVLKSELSDKEAVKYMIVTMLISPDFLFNYEVNKGSTRDPYNLANALSFALTNKPADSTLMALADSGEILNDKKYAEQAQRLIGSDDNHNVILDYFLNYMDVSRLSLMTKSKEKYPIYTDEVINAMRREFNSSILNGLKNKDSLYDLMTAKDSYITEPLKDIYKMQLTNGNNEIKVSLNPMQRRGLMSKPAFITVQTSDTESNPVRMGMFVLSRMLCQVTPVLPRDVNVSFPPRTPGQTKRESLSEHSKSPACIGCHKVIDPIGFAMESYNTIGEFRYKEEGSTIDTTADLTFLPVTKEKTETAVEVIDLISGAPEFHQCFVKHLFRYVNGREEVESDNAHLRSTYFSFVSGGFDIEKLMYNLVTSYEFKNRKML